jgi:tRNA 2-selenouridine synthase
LIQDITAQEMLDLKRDKGLTLIDVRAPQEFADGSVPDSINIPIFDDEERKEIGTLYKQVNIQAAKRKGLQIVSAKLPAFIEQFERIPGRKAVFCWRGGMRSKTAATLLDLMGIRVYRLSGGIRSYRKWVVHTLENFEWKPQCVVINGYTGTGKTQILRTLAEQGYPVLDLEHMANHRGSIFGQIGLEPHNQKTFESLLADRLLAVNDQPYVLIEAESKRIGKVVLPDFIVKAKENGVQLFIDIPVLERVRNVIEEYQPERHKEECLKAFHLIKNKLHTPIAADIEKHMQENRFAEAVKMLLAYYYDPRYEHAIQQYGGERIVLKAGTMEEAIQAVICQLQRM